MKRIFNHPKYKLYSGNYLISDDGKVFNLKTNRLLKIHKNKRSKMLFVRLSASKNDDLTIGVGRLVLLTFSPKSYFKNAIAIHCDGKQNNNCRNNLIWGTRKIQTKIQMSNKTHSKRVRMMAKIYHNSIYKDKMVHKLKLLGVKNVMISKIINCSEQTVRISLHRQGYKLNDKREFVK